MEKAGDPVGDIIIFHKTRITKVWMFSFLNPVRTLVQNNHFTCTANCFQSKFAKNNKNFSFVDDMMDVVLLGDQNAE
jgi:hypothetical protein